MRMSGFPYPARRQFLGLSAATVASSLIPGAAFGQLTKPARLPRTIPFGVALSPSQISTDLPYAQAVLAHADFVVPEWGMKWADIRPTRDAFNFEMSDRAATFARTHNLGLRGHTLLWNEVNPKWVEALSTARDAEHEMRRHIERVMARYKGLIRSWDVVNEPIADKPSTGENLRRGVWTDRLGADYIGEAVKVARGIDPTAELIVNEYGIDHATPEDKAKRASFRLLIRRLLDRGMPLDGVGLQAHLNGAQAIDTHGISAFVAEMRAWGLKVLVTELDVNDKALPPDITERDRRAALHVKTYLEAVLAGGRPQSIATWGLTDRYTWMPRWHSRSDGLPNRPLPLDTDLTPKPFLAVIEDICRRPG